MDQLFIVVNINRLLLFVLLLFGCTVVLFTSSNFNIIFQRIILNKFNNMAGVMTNIVIMKWLTCISFMVELIDQRYRQVGCMLKPIQIYRRGFIYQK